MGTLDRTIYPLTNITRQTCFDIRRFSCCGDQVGSVDGFRLDLYREGKEDIEDLLVSYDFFHVDEDTGMLCVIWDAEINGLCQGRYIGYIHYECRLVDKVRFIIGGKYSVESVDQIESSAPDCFSDTIPMGCDGVVEPDQCCEDECDAVDPCEPYGDPCECPESVGGNGV